MLKSKIHRATVTDADLNYEGSISIDPVLCKAADLVEFEKVDVYDIDNGNRFHTYVIFGGSKEICLNGAAARLVCRGDKVIIGSYQEVDDSEIDAFKPKLVMVDEENAIKQISEPETRRP